MADLITFIYDLAILFWEVPQTFFTCVHSICHFLGALYFGNPLAYSIMIIIIIMFIISYYSACERKWWEGDGPYFLLPFVRHLAFYRSRSLHLSLPKMSMKYRSPFTVMYGRMKIIVLTTVEEMVARFNYDDDNFSNPSLFVSSGLTNSFGIASDDFKQFFEHKRIAGRIIVNLYRSVCMNKNSDILVHELSKLPQLNIPFDAHFLMRRMSANMLADLLLGIVYTPGYSREDDDFARQMDNIDVRQRDVEMLNLINYHPFLRHFPYFKSVYRRRQANQKEFITFLREIVDHHRRNPRRYVNQPTDFIHEYFHEEMCSISEGINIELFSDDRLCHVLADLFGAGIQLMTSTLKWCLVYLALNPAYVRLAQDEMDRTIGQKFAPDRGDIVRLPYTRAVIMECQRLGNVLPIGFPKGTKTGEVVFNLLSNILIGPPVYDEQKYFKPERLLDMLGNIDAENVPNIYGVGVRCCPCKEMAESSVFLIISTLIYRFNVKMPDGDRNPTCAPDFGVTLDPGAFRITLQDRFHRMLR